MELQRLLDTLEPLPEPCEFLGMDALRRQTVVTANLYPDLVTVREVGRSSAGEPIEMISIGDGPKSALLIGAPHANEPIGCLAIEHLIKSLCAIGALRQALPFRWHFIKAIEPDALRLNEAWLSRPASLHNYLSGFFRSALCDQAEYLFPFEGEVAHSVSPTAENDAYRSAISIAAPDLLYPMHGCDFGGTFYILSREAPGLVEALQAQPLRHGLRLNAAGESSHSPPSFAPGVFAPFDVAAVVRADQDAHGGSSSWMGGDQSVSYAARRGILAIIAEMSLWDWGGERPSEPVGFSAKDLRASRAQIDEAIVALGGAVMDAFEADVIRVDPLIRRAASEIVTNAKSRCLVEASTGDLLYEPPAEAATRQYISQRINGLRQLALVGRMRGDASTSAPVTQASSRLLDFVERSADDLLTRFDIVPTSLATAARAQAEAALIAAWSLADRRSKEAGGSGVLSPSAVNHSSDSGRACV